MEVELLHIADCPGVDETRSRLRSVLDAAGLGDIPIRERLLLRDAETEKLAFAGSPTVLIDGADAVPGAPLLTTLACRVYTTAAGLRPAPSVEQLTAAVAAAPRR